MLHLLEVISISTIISFHAVKCSMRARVFQGNDVSYTDYPYVGELEIHFGDVSGVCSSVFVQPDLILTSAHCFIGEKPILPTTVDVTVNKDTKVTIPASYVKPHPGYEFKKFKDDIAVIYVKDPVTLPRYADWQKSTKSDCQTLQWGYILGREEGKITRGKSRIDQASCCQVNTGLNCSYTMNHYACLAAENDQAPVPGDSGGPLLLASPDKKDVVVGVAAYAPDILGNKANIRFGSAYTCLAVYRDWVRQTYEELKKAAGNSETEVGPGG